MAGKPIPAEYIEFGSGGGCERLVSGRTPVGNEGPSAADGAKKVKVGKPVGRRRESVGSGPGSNGKASSVTGK